MNRKHQVFVTLEEISERLHIRKQFEMFCTRLETVQDCSSKLDKMDLYKQYLCIRKLFSTQ